jgi:soluble lytic murein transglycosylase-like protein
VKLALLFCILSSIGLGPNHAHMIANNILLSSEYQGVDSLLVAAVIYEESRFNPNLISKTHDYGLMQVHCPDRLYAPWCMSRQRLLKPSWNIFVGTLILRRARLKCERMFHHGHHWIQHYNWYSKGYAERILETYHKLKDHENVCRTAQQ